MNKLFLIWGSLLGGLGVILGAFGAHRLKAIAPEVVPTFQTGVQYQMYHAFALLITGILFSRFPGKALQAGGFCFLIGVLLFSGSLYLLAALKATGKVGITGLGILTPIGGLFFIAGWVCLIWAFFRQQPA